MKASIHAPKGWNPGSPLESIGEIDAADIDHRGGQGTVSGAGCRALLALLPVNGFGMVTFDLHMAQVVLTGCRVLAMGNGDRMGFSYTGSRPVG